MTPFLAVIAFLAAVMSDARAEHLRIGTEGAFVPFNYFDKQGQLTGFDTDIAQAVCQEMGATCEFVISDLPAIIDGLEQDRYDVIIASISITPERRQRVLFTDRYYSNALRFVAARQHELPGTKPGELRGMRLGAQAGSIAANYLEKNHGQSAIVRLFGNQEEVFNELLVGNVDAVLTDALPAYDWLQTLDGQCCAFASLPIKADEGIAMAVRKNDTALRDRLNAALSAIIGNGTYERINSRYFPFSIY